MLAERQITCQACGADFEFTTEEQEFYQAKGFQEPKKCKPCRSAAKQARGGSGGGGGYGGRAPRQMYDVTCAACNAPTQVPFQPTGAKPVYCRDCFQANSGY